MTQIGLFDFDEPAKPQVKEQPEQKNNVGDWCLIYLVTRSGGNSGNLFVLHREDAIKLCSDECSHGIARGGHWMFNWTSLDHFYDSKNASAADRQMRNVYGDLEPFVFIKDTGKQDKDFERLGIKKPNIYEIEDVLNSIGYKLQYKGERPVLDRIRDGESCITIEEFRQTEKQMRKR